MIEFASQISEKLKIRQQQAESVLALLEEGATIPLLRDTGKTVQVRWMKLSFRKFRMNPEYSGHLQKEKQL